MNLPPAKWHEDLMVFARGLAQRHANAFHFISRAAFQTEVDQLDARLPTLTADEIFVGMDQIANSIGDGHTGMRLPADTPSFPLDFERFGDSYRLIAAAPVAKAASVLGQTLVAIDGAPIERVHAQLLTLTPADETPALRELRATGLLNSGLVLHGLGLAPSRDAVRYTFSSAAGVQTTLAVDANSATPRSDWLQAATKVALYRQHPDEPLWCSYLEKASAVYCIFQSYKDMADTSKAMRDLIREKKPQFFIVDLRRNNGGDFTLGLRYLINPIARMPELNRKGHLFVLIGPQTFSAAMSNASQFRARTNALLVGQTIGEKPNSYQEVRTLSLPNSGWVVRYSTRFYTFTNGPENLIRPDKDIEETWDDYKAGYDPVLDWVVQQCASERP